MSSDCKHPVGAHVQTLERRLRPPRPRGQEIANDYMEVAVTRCATCGTVVNERLLTYTQDD